MELVLFLAFMFVGFALLFGGELVRARKQEKRWMQNQLTSWGEAPRREYSPDRFARIPGYYLRHRREGMLDDITWNDLNMDAVFKRMNYAFSAAGEEYLYGALRDIAKSREELARLEEVTAFFMEHPKERVQVQWLMKQLGHTGKFSLYDYIDNLDYLGERSNRKHYLLNVLFIPLLGCLPFWFSPALLGLLGLIIYNILTYFREKNEIEPYIVSFAYVMRLIQTAEKVCRVPVPVCAEEYEQIRGYSHGLESMKRGAWLVLSSGRSGMGGNPLEIFLDYLRMVFHLDLILFNRMLKELRLHRQDVDGLITQLGFLETCICVGLFRKSLPRYALPELLCQGDGTALALQDAWHPLLENAVCNSITAGRGVLITGSNASGKSTFLKTVAVNAILAQTIHTVTAAAYRAPCYRIYSSMALQDNMEGGESYYIVEIKAMKRILDAAGQPGPPVLCFVDEVLRGTNTVERIAASTQILQSLAGKNILCFAATHDIELTELLKESYDNYHFEEEVSEGRIVFNYRLLSGRAATRNAIRLLELLGYDPGITREAARQAEHFLETGGWT